GLQGRFIFDLVDVGRGEHERGEHDEMQETPDHRALITSSSAGKRGNRRARSPPIGAAALRSAARNLAERARGLRFTSSSLAITGLRTRIRKLGAALATSG